tara:strand:+ start:28276 stop:28425 length:150 start_codon:yes stop_codon:yes gene_type:complete
MKGVLFKYDNRVWMVIGETVPVSLGDYRNCISTCGEIRILSKALWGNNK